ncbi:hypothetical protein PVK06_016906 [Gossypium arboreum]|uniref:Uncharacterized protein n=2 Tax=Gossypium arboreum TaxID=29729 RepID=A0ABR0Q175_GOSAR|nr:hypothetical protein PVK06_016906 [Gossypium arboreum]
MENPGSNQLPEVDSLPDGFVESPSEILAPKTPISKEEKPLHPDCKEDDLVSSEFGANKGQKQRTFPVPLSEADGFEGSADYVEGKVVCPELSNSVPEAAECSEVKEVKGKCESTETCIGGGSETNLTALKESSSSESIDLPKNKKTETTETKRKSAKRTSKSEKEFLEFSLKYQQVLAERDTAVAVRDKLESLCRELQRQNKMLMDECKRVSMEGQNLRLDLSARFQDAIKDVSNKLEEQKDDCLSQLKENEMLRNKLKELAEQYALSEQQYAQKLKQKTLELQLSDLKIKQHEEKLIQEQAQMKVYAEQVSQLLVTEKNLRMQLTADGEKFQQFQDALSKSNEVFETFKQEIEKMAKSIKELRKENVFLKSKCDKSDFTLIELVEERERMKKQLEKTKNQKEKLESLCRSLQAERKQSSTGSNGSNSLADQICKKVTSEMDFFFRGLNEDFSSSQMDILRCPFLRNINEPTNFSFSSALPFPMPVRGAKGPIFEDGPNFDMAFRLFHGRDGVVPLSGRSSLRIEKAETETAPPKFNPLAAKAATISLSSFGPGGPFSFDAFSNKWNNQKGKGKGKSSKNESSSQGGKSNHEAMGNEWLQNGSCPIAKSYRAVSGVLPLVAKVLQPPPGMKYRCPPAVVAARAALAQTAFAKNLRPQSLPTKVLVIGMLGMAANVPLGIWREHTEKFSPSWFVAIHAAVPFIAMLRKSVLMPKTAMAFTIAASVLGQVIGSRAERYRLKAVAAKQLGMEESSVSVGGANQLDIVAVKNSDCRKDVVEWEPVSIQVAMARPSSSTDVFC